MLICPAAMFTMTAGIKKGEILRGPPCSRLVCSRSMISKPPMPEPIKTPTRSAFSGVIFEARLRHRFLRGGKSKVDEAPHLARFLFVHKIQRVKVLDLGGKRDRKAGCVEALNRAPCRWRRPAAAATPRERCCPHRTPAQGR